MGLEPIGVNEDDVVLKEELPTGVSDPSQLAASSDIPTSASEVNAMSDSYSAPVQSVNGQSGNVNIDTLSVGSYQRVYYDEESGGSFSDTYSDTVSGLKFVIAKAQSNDDEVNASASIQVDGDGVISMSGYPSGIQNETVSVSTFVPPGSNYEAALSGGSSSRYYTAYFEVWELELT